jgi:hypothetical protein
MNVEVVFPPKRRNNITARYGNRKMTINRRETAVIICISNGFLKHFLTVRVCADVNCFDFIQKLEVNFDIHLYRLLKIELLCLIINM